MTQHMVLPLSARNTSGATSRVSFDSGLPAGEGAVRRRERRDPTETGPGPSRITDALLQRVCGDLSDPMTGIAFTVPLDRVEGLAPPLPEGSTG